MSSKEKEQLGNPSHLIIRYLSGNATDEEVRLLEDWVLASPENRDLFMAEKQTWWMASTLKGDPRIDLDGEWNSLSRQLFDNARIVSITNRNRSRRQWWVIAAAIAVVILASVWIFQPGPAQSLTLAAGDTVLEQVLPDGSRITLNRNTSIVFTPDAKGQRLLVLDGEAFFEVVKDTRPFVIKTQDVEIEVLGTSFYIDSRQVATEVRVVVESGSVAFRHDKEELRLHPGDLGKYDKKTNDLSQMPNPDENYLSWKSDILNFSDIDLIEVVEVLNRHFNAAISIENSSLEHCKITAVFTNKSLDAIIRIIEKTLNVESRSSGEQIIFFGTGCE